MGKRGVRFASSVIVRVSVAVSSSDVAGVLSSSVAVTVMVKGPSPPAAGVPVMTPALEMARLVEKPAGAEIA